MFISETAQETVKQNLSSQYSLKHLKVVKFKIKNLRANLKHEK